MRLDAWHAGSLDGAVEEVNEACLHSILAATRETEVEFQLILHWGEETVLVCHVIPRDPHRVKVKAHGPWQICSQENLHPETFDITGDWAPHVDIRRASRKLTSKLASTHIHLPCEIPKTGSQLFTNKCTGLLLAHKDALLYTPSQFSHTWEFESLFLDGQMSRARITQAPTGPASNGILMRTWRTFKSEANSYQRGVPQSQATLWASNSSYSRYMRTSDGFGHGFCSGTAATIANLSLSVFRNWPWTCAWWFNQP